jgi:ubiquinone/menaquinone biosynthesis C-methylase UbiE
MNGDTNERNFKVMQGFFARGVDYWHSLYEGEAFLTRHMADRKRIVLDLVQRYSGGQPRTVLDLGCGTGVLTLELLRRGHVVTALDCTREMLDRLRTSVAESGFTTFRGAVEAYAQDTAFPTGHFDGIICIGVFQYQWSDDDLLREISRLLKQGGFCVFTLPNLLRLNYCLDPLYHLRFAARLVRAVGRRLTTSRRAAEPGRWVSGESTREAYPYNRKYFFWQLNKAMARHGLEACEAVGFGYGPLTLLGRPVLPETASMKISGALDRLTRRLSVLRFVSNRWAFVVRKT